MRFLGWFDLLYDIILLVVKTIINVRLPTVNKSMAMVVRVYVCVCLCVCIYDIPSVCVCVCLAYFICLLVIKKYVIQDNCIEIVFLYRPCYLIFRHPLGTLADILIAQNMWHLDIPRVSSISHPI